MFGSMRSIEQATDSFHFSKVRFTIFLFSISKTFLNHQYSYLQARMKEHLLYLISTYYEESINSSTVQVHIDIGSYSILSIASEKELNSYL